MERYEVEEGKNQEVGEERRGSQFSAQPRAQPQTSGWAWRRTSGLWLTSLRNSEGSQIGLSNKLQKAQLSLYFRGQIIF